MDARQSARDIVKSVFFRLVKNDDLNLNDRWMDVSISLYWPTATDRSSLWSQVLEGISRQFELPSDNELLLFDTESLKDSSPRDIIGILSAELPNLTRKEARPQPGSALFHTIREESASKSKGFGFTAGNEPGDVFVHINKTPDRELHPPEPSETEASPIPDESVAPPHRKPRDPSTRRLDRARAFDSAPEEESVDSDSHTIAPSPSSPVSPLEDWPASATAPPTEYVVASDDLPMCATEPDVQPEATIVRVFYATDRLQLPKVTSDIQYSAGRSPMGILNLGKCEISIPKKHRLGKLESPSILRLEFSPDPRKHIVLKKTFPLEERKFFEQVKESVSKSAAKDAFVFVHGYNVSFEDAARRTGQIAYDLNFVGAPVFYSWPSNGKMADYTMDETNVTWSTPHLQRFLALLSQNSGAQRIHVIAHSMGNRAVCEALKALSYDTTSKLKFNHLVLAAPDIDADTFRELASTLQRLSARITLYESSKDKALFASKALHGNPRAGEPLLIIPGLDTIDASAIDTNFLGHSYFSDNYPLLSDIHSILFRDELPATRFGLEQRSHADGMYFAFKA